MCFSLNPEDITILARITKDRNAILYCQYGDVTFDLAIAYDKGGTTSYTPRPRAYTMRVTPVRRGTSGLTTVIPQAGTYSGIESCRAFSKTRFNAIVAARLHLHDPLALAMIARVVENPRAVIA